MNGRSRAGPAALGLLLPLLLTGIAPADASARQSERRDQAALYAALLDQARLFLERSGETFYAVGAYVDTAGKQWGFTPETWPAFTAPPDEWEDSLVAGTHHLYPPARSVAWLLDLAPRDDSRPPDSLVARFHYEGRNGVCASLRRAYVWKDNGTIAWGAETALPCARRSALAAAKPGSTAIRAPLGPAMLTGGRFVAYTLLWQVSVPGGDPIVFKPDGTVENARAGLAGRWRIADDSTLVIRQTDGITRDTTARVFRLRRAAGDLVSPPLGPRDSRSPVFWIRLAAAPPP